MQNMPMSVIQSLSSPIKLSYRPRLKTSDEQYLSGVNQNLIAQIDALGETTSYTYDANGFQTSVRDPSPAGGPYVRPAGA